MRPDFRAALLALLALPAAATTARAQAPDPARVDAVFAQWARPGAPGCAVGVSRAGVPVLERAYGLAELEHGVANQANTIFEAGSVTKQFTAAAVILLAQQGKLSLDDDVRRWIPELPEYDRPLTIRDLFSHTSGMRDWGTVASAAGWPRTSRAYDHDHVLDIIVRQRSLNYVPGAEYSYTNTPYTLLAILAERASGESLPSFTRREIFQPLGMTLTSWRDDFTRVVPGRATAYAPAEGGGWRILMPFENGYGNGGLLTTVGDLLRWTENLESGKVGGEGLIREMHRRARLNDGRELTYASGIVVSEYRGVPEVGHSGSTAGYRAYLARYPNQRAAVAVLCNVASGAAESYAHRVADLVLGDAARDPAPPATATMPAARLAAHAGLFRSTRTLEPYRVAVEEGELRLNGTPLRPLADGSFALGQSPTRARFELGAGGSPTAVTLTAEDGDAHRLEAIPPATPTAAQLAAYAGRWRSEEAEVEYEVALNGNRLELRRRPGVVMPLQPEYADAFTADDAGWLVRFLRGPDGQVAEMSLGMGRVRDLRFRRVGMD